MFQLPSEVLVAAQVAFPCLTAAVEGRTVELVPTRRPKLLVLLRRLPSLVSAALFGTGEKWPGTDVVVKETGTGHEVLRLIGNNMADAAQKVVKAAGAK